MKTWVISDTHSLHRQLNVPEVDLVIHCGDSTNFKSLIHNEIEFEDFLDWFKNLPIKHKILIAGNHDAWATKKYNKEKVKNLGIYYLEHEYLELEGFLFFGSPYTPVFHDWYFMVDRSKLDRYWDVLIEGIDVLITHGPPKGILDLSYGKVLEFCGDGALRKKIFKTSPKIHCFGHIHNVEDIINQGTREINETKFINASCVTDGKFERLSSHGIIIDI